MLWEYLAQFTCYCRYLGYVVYRAEPTRIVLLWKGGGVGFSKESVMKLKADILKVKESFILVLEHDRLIIQILCK